MPLDKNPESKINPEAEDAEVIDIDDLDLSETTPVKSNIGVRNTRATGKPALASEVDKVTHEIRDLYKKAANNVAAIGDHLIRMKAKLGHGEFAKWYEREFGWNMMTVSRYMNAARNWQAILKRAPNAKIETVPPTLLYGYAKMPEDQQRKITDAAKKGTKLKAGDFEKPTTSAKASTSTTSTAAQATSAKGDASTSTPASTSNTNKTPAEADPDVEKLAKLIAKKLTPAGCRDIGGNHPGFKPSLAKVLQKKIEESYTGTF